MKAGPRWQDFTHIPLLALGHKLAGSSRSLAGTLSLICAAGAKIQAHRVFYKKKNFLPSVHIVHIFRSLAENRNSIIQGV